MHDQDGRLWGGRGKTLSESHGADTTSCLCPWIQFRGVRQQDRENKKRDHVCSTRSKKAMGAERGE